MAPLRWVRTLTGYGAVLAFLGGTGCGATPDDSGDDAARGGEAVWSDDSEAIAIDWFSFWQGGTRFEKRREQLTEEEVALLADLKTLVSTGECWSDVGEAEVTVTGNGSAQEYSANEYDGDCDRGVELVTYAPVIGLLESARCLTAKGYDGSSLATAGHVRADDGCYHGIFNATATTREWWFVLEVAEPATYRVTIDDCGDRELDLDLLDEAGADVLGSATTAPGACPLLVHPFPSAGVYALHLDMSAGTHAGDFFLRVETEPR